MKSQGDIWWADLGHPTGSAAGFRRPVLIVQSDSLNWSRLATVVCVPLTSNLDWAEAPGCVLIPRSESELRKDSVANCTGILAVDKSILTEPAGRISKRMLGLVLAAIDVVLGK